MTTEEMLPVEENLSTPREDEQSFPSEEETSIQPTDLRVPSKHGQLPGGLLHEGQVLRDIVFSELTGKKREPLGDPNLTKNFPKLMEHVLCSCVESIGPITKITPSVVERILIGDKDYCTIKIFDISHDPNDPPGVPFNCSQCGKPGDGIIDVSQFEIYDIEDALDSITTVGIGREQRQVRTFVVEVPQYEIRAVFRHGDGFDERALHRLGFGNPIAAESALIAMTLVELTYKGKKSKPGLERKMLDEMPDGAIKYLHARYFEHACGVELSHQITCFRCGKETEVTFTAVDFLLRPRRVSRKSTRRFS